MKLHKKYDCVIILMYSIVKISQVLIFLYKIGLFDPWVARQVTQVKSLWHRRSKRRVGEWAVMYVKQQKGWRMSCDVGKATEGLEIKLWRRWSDRKLGEWPHSSFSNPSVALPTSQLILQPFHCFTYVIAHSPTLLSLLLRHKLFAYVTWRAAHGS